MIGRAFGSILCVINLLNIDKSSQYVHGDKINNSRLGAIAIFKGVIYGTFYPIGMFFICVDMCDGDSFKRHFVPLTTKYYSEKI